MLGLYSADGSQTRLQADDSGNFVNVTVTSPTDGGAELKFDFINGTLEISYPTQNVSMTYQLPDNDDSNGSRRLDALSSSKIFNNAIRPRNNKRKNLVRGLQNDLPAQVSIFVEECGTPIDAPRDIRVKAYTGSGQKEIPVVPERVAEGEYLAKIPFDETLGDCEPSLDGVAEPVSAAVEDYIKDYARCAVITCK